MSEKQYDDEMRMVGFSNEKATPENRQPQWRCTMQIRGEKFKISLWQTRSRGGKDMLSGKIEVDDREPERRDQAPAQPDGPADGDARFIDADVSSAPF